MKVYQVVIIADKHGTLTPADIERRIQPYLNIESAEVARNTIIACGGDAFIRQGTVTWEDTPHVNQADESLRRRGLRRTSTGTLIHVADRSEEGES